jgi:hypothetical protein
MAGERIGRKLTLRIGRGGRMMEIELAPRELAD